MQTKNSYTDIGNSERFIKQHNNDVRFCPQDQKWLIWVGDRWMQDDSGQVFQKAKETAMAIEKEIDNIEDQELQKEIIAHCKRSQAWSRINAMVKLAKTDPEIQIDIEALDTDPMLLNCQNGTIDLTTGELLPHSREDYITKSTQVPYDKSAQCPLWLAFLYKIMAGNQNTRPSLSSGLHLRR